MHLLRCDITDAAPQTQKKEGTNKSKAYMSPSTYTRYGVRHESLYIVAMVCGICGMQDSHYSDILPPSRI